MSSTDLEFNNKGLPFMFFRAAHKDARETKDKYVVLIAINDYTYADTAWMMDNNLPEGMCYRPTVDILVEGDNTFEFDTEMEMIQFVANWFAENYPKK